MATESTVEKEYRGTVTLLGLADLISVGERAFDSFDGKLVVSGRNRNECMMRLRRTLHEFVIDGIKTTIPLFQELVNEPDFINGEYHIHWLEDFLKKQQG